MVRISIEKIQDYIRSHAQEYFPATELWLNANTLQFFAWDEDESTLWFTEGRVEGDKILYHTVENGGEDNTAMLDAMIEQKEREGYFCFAM